MRTTLALTAAIVLTVAGFALAQGPRGPAEHEARTPQQQEQQTQRRAERLELRADAVTMRTALQKQLRSGECGEIGDATATMQRLQRGPQARW